MRKAGLFEARAPVDDLADRLKGLGGPDHKPSPAEVGDQLHCRDVECTPSDQRRAQPRPSGPKRYAHNPFLERAVGSSPQQVVRTIPRILPMPRCGAETRDDFAQHGAVAELNEKHLGPKVGGHHHTMLPEPRLHNRREGVGPEAFESRLGQFAREIADDDLRRWRRSR